MPAQFEEKSSGRVQALAHPILDVMGAGESILSITRMFKPSHKWIISTFQTHFFNSMLSYPAFLWEYIGGILAKYN
jgi:hypothetical protein